MNRTEQKERFKTLLLRLDKKYIGSVYGALKRQYRSFVEDFRLGGRNYAVSRMNTQLLNEQIGPVIKRIHKEAGVAMAHQTYSRLTKSKRRLKYRGFGFNEEWTRDVQNYFDKYLLEKAVLPISETTRDIILNKLKQAVENGWSVEETLAAIGNIPEIRNRARRIVRTETVRAANYGKMLGADTYDYEVEVEWMSVHDNRTRHTHRFIDGQRREEGKKFSNGLLFPGDPSGPASETINCRCTISHVAKRDSSGALIPKKSGVTVRPGGSLLEDFVRQSITI